MRHAKSAWDTGAATDFERPLSGRGRRDAPRMGAWLRTQGLRPDLVLSSPAARASKTAFLVCKELDIPRQEINWDERIYGAGPSDLLGILGEQPRHADRVLLVGHNPGMEELLCYLWGDATRLPPDGKLMPTAALAHLAMPDDWTKLHYGCARLRSLIRPKELGHTE